MPRIETIGDATLYLGDCREIFPTLGKVDAVVTDPPYGMKRHGRYQRGRNSTSVTPYAAKTNQFGVTIAGDDQPFDPSPWLEIDHVVLWGANHFASRLPLGTTLVWIKRSDAGFGSFLSDAEIAWAKDGHGVYCKRDLSIYGVHRRDHPTQKPVGLMEWCIERAKVSVGETILDPFMGSGTTGVAAVKLGRKFIGIEIEPKYFDIACRRIAETARQTADPAHRQLELLKL